LLGYELPEDLEVSGTAAAAELLLHC